MSPLWSIWTRPVIPSNDRFLIAATIKAPFESSSRCSPAANAKSMTASYRFAAYEFALSWVRRCCINTHVRVLQRHYSCTFTREMPARTPLFFPGRTLTRTHACVQARMHSCARTRAHAHKHTHALIIYAHTHAHACAARTHAHVHKKTPARSRQRMRP